MSASSRAVFLSYASQDAPAAARLCEALSNAGLEVWFDKSELRGGDAWDASIRRQIRTCTLFIPIISANTDARTEGYFRREWKLAAERMLDMADDHAFLLPVAIDGTSESSARVPDAFRERQWTRYMGGQPPVEFVERVRRLIGMPQSSVPLPSSAVAPLHELDSPLTSKDATQPARPRSTIDVRQIERIPAARSSMGILSYFAIACVLGSAVAVPLVMWLTGESSKFPFRIHHSEVRDARHVVAALAPPSTENADLWRLFSIQGKQELLRHFKEGLPAEDELKTVLVRELNALIDGTRALDNSAGSAGDSLPLANRRLLESRFQEDLSTLLKPRGYFSNAKERFLESQGFRWVTGGLAAILISLGVAHYYVYRPVAIRYVFDDLRHIDEILVYLMGELGFRAPVSLSGTLLYRPTLSTFLIWGPVSFTARIDGVSIVITGPSMLMKRLAKALAAFIQADRLAVP